MERYGAQVGHHANIAEQLKSSITYGMRNIHSGKWRTTALVALFEGNTCQPTAPILGSSLDEQLQLIAILKPALITSSLAGAKVAARNRLRPHRVYESGQTKEGSRKLRKYKDRTENATSA